MKMKIGSVDLKHGLFLAPMAGFSDRAMRRVCHEMGAEYSVSEMISAKAVTFGDKKTFSLAAVRPDEGPVALQIFGSEPEIMGEAARILTERQWGEGYASPVAIDINMGCPVHKIFSNGEGSALMRDPELIYRIVRAVKDNTDLPVTVKHRTGIDTGSLNAVECALAAEAGGAELITVHGRTKAQMYSGTVDRETIKNVKQSVRIPVIANGDILSGADALSMLADTGADGVAIGRGAVGNPFVFGEIAAALGGAEYKAPTLEEKVATALWQLRLAIEDKGEGKAVPEARKQIASYLHSFKGAAKIRVKINQALTYAEIEKIFEDAMKDEIADS